MVNYFSKEVKNLELVLINGSEPMQNDQAYFFNDIYLNFYNFTKIIF